MTEIFYVIVGFLLILAVFDLFVGVSNDAVNFLQSAIGAKVARFRTVLIVASAGVLIGASGALLIIFQSSAINTDSSGNWIGNLLCIVNVITYAIYLVITRPISQRYSAITLMKWMFLFSALISFPPGISDLPEAKVFGTESNPFVILKLSYIVIMATGIAYFLVPMALKRIRPTTASMYNNLQPIIASIIAILIGQDVFSWDKPIAALLVFTGVYLVTQSKAKEEVKGIK